MELVQPIEQLLIIVPLIILQLTNVLLVVILTLKIMMKQPVKKSLQIV